MFFHIQDFFMKVYKLVDLAKQSSQTDIAKKFGLTQGAIHQAQKKKRNIFFVEEKNKELNAVEVKAVFNSRINLDDYDIILRKKKNPKSLKETQA